MFSTDCPRSPTRVDKMSFYDNFAEFYDNIVAGFDYSKVAEYYDGLIRQNGVSGGILLDLACGTGTLSTLMARKGWDVIGVDSSPEMLSIAAQRNDSSEPDKISYICQDMTELDLYGTVDAAVCCFDSLNHILEESDLRRVFEKVSLFMNHGGVFVFDINTIFCHETIFADNIFTTDADDGGVFCARQHFKEKNNVTVIALSIFARQENGLYERHNATNAERAYALGPVKSLCEQSGFEIVGCYDFLTLNQADENNQRVVFVCSKTEKAV